MNTITCVCFLQISVSVVEIMSKKWILVLIKISLDNLLLIIYSKSNKQLWCPWWLYRNRNCYFQRLEWPTMRFFLATPDYYPHWMSAWSFWWFRWSVPRFRFKHKVIFHLFSHLVSSKFNRRQISILSLASSRDNNQFKLRHSYHAGESGLL